MKEDDYFYYNDLPSNKEESIRKLYNYLEFVGFSFDHRKSYFHDFLPITLFEYTDGSSFSLASTSEDDPELKNRITKEELEKLCKLGELYES